MMTHFRPRVGSAVGLHRVARAWPTLALGNGRGSRLFLHNVVSDQLRHSKELFPVTHALIFSATCVLALLFAASYINPLEIPSQLWAIGCIFSVCLMLEFGRNLKSREISVYLTFPSCSCFICNFYVHFLSLKSWGFCSPPDKYSLSFELFTDCSLYWSFSWSQSEDRTILYICMYIYT